MPATHPLNAAGEVQSGAVEHRMHATCISHAPHAATCCTRPDRIAIPSSPPQAQGWPPPSPATGLLALGPDGALTLYEGEPRLLEGAMQLHTPPGSKRPASGIIGSSRAGSRAAKRAKVRLPAFSPEAPFRRWGRELHTHGLALSVRSKEAPSGGEGRTAPR
jgi:hypothetical protein